MVKKIQHLGFLLSFVINPIVLLAQPTIHFPQNPLLREGLDYYDPGVGVRALGMGGAVVARLGDASSLWWNPAGLKSDSLWSVEISGFAAQLSLLDVEKENLGNQASVFSPSYVGLQIPITVKKMPISLGVTYQNEHDYSNMKRGLFRRGDLRYRFVEPIQYQNELWSVDGSGQEIDNNILDNQLNRQSFTFGFAFEPKKGIRLGAALKAHIYDQDMESELQMASYFYARGLARRDENDNRIELPIPAGNSSDVLLQSVYTSKAFYSENRSVALQPNFGAQFDLFRKKSWPVDITFGVQFSPQIKHTRSFTYRVEAEGVLQEFGLSQIGTESVDYYQSRDLSYTAETVPANEYRSEVNFALPARLGLGFLVNYKRLSLSVDAQASSPLMLEVEEFITDGLMEVSYSDQILNPQGEAIEGSESGSEIVTAEPWEGLSYPETDMSELRVGLEYVAGKDENMFFRLGYQRMNRLSSGSFFGRSYNFYKTTIIVSPENFPSYSRRNFFSLGFGAKVKNIEFDVAYTLQHATQGRIRWWSEEEVDNVDFPPEVEPIISPTTTNLPPFEWEKFIHRVSVGLRYNFGL